MSKGPVAVVDIGSNTIKLLVAARAPDGSFVQLARKSADARISAGISADRPRLSAAGMGAGVAAVRDLLEVAAAYEPGRTVIVATSAVRDADNGGEFRERVRAATGHDVRVLSGEEEANLIGRGLSVDPALRDRQDFYLFDLGGGSLECLAFRARRIEQSVSLPLGCVRLTERFVADPQAPFGDDSARAVADHSQAMLGKSGFGFVLGPGAFAVGTGGTMTTARGILAARRNETFDDSTPLVSLAQLRELLEWLGNLPLAERRRVPGLPKARADVFPTALTTLIAVADAGRFSAYHNSLYNLRYGIADEALGA